MITVYYNNIFLQRNCHNSSLFLNNIFIVCYAKYFVCVMYDVYLYTLECPQPFLANQFSNPNSSFMAQQNLFLHRLNNGLKNHPSKVDKLCKVFTLGFCSHFNQEILGTSETSSHLLFFCECLSCRIEADSIVIILFLLIPKQGKHKQDLSKKCSAWKSFVSVPFPLDKSLVLSS